MDSILHEKNVLLQCHQKKLRCILFILIRVWRSSTEWFGNPCNFGCWWVRKSRACTIVKFKENRGWKTKNVCAKMLKEKTYRGHTTTRACIQREKDHDGLQASIYHQVWRTRFFYIDVMLYSVAELQMILISLFFTPVSTALSKIANTCIFWWRLVWVVSCGLF